MKRRRKIGYDDGDGDSSNGQKKRGRQEQDKTSKTLNSLVGKISM
jgi:hypothetical protein